MASPPEEDKALAQDKASPPAPHPTPSPQKSDSIRLEVLHQIRAELVAYLGPLPNPETLARFEQIVPGSAARIMNMAESQTIHRQFLEKTVIQAGVQKSWWGLWTGFVIGMTGIIGAVVLGVYDHPIVGGILGSGTIVSLVSVFVIGSKGKREELGEKAAAVQEKPGQSRDTRTGDRETKNPS
jgi:uncharacterized membrane protein